MVFDEVQADLEAIGYEVTPFLLPACAVNAPHRRDRIWFIAHSNLYGSKQCNSEYEINSSEGRINAFGDSESIHIEQSITQHSNCIGQERRMYKVKSKATIRKQFSERNACSIKPTNWKNFPTQSPICVGDDGISDKLDGITFSKWRNESIKSAGNAIVPQVALQIFKAIEQYERI
jgi:DNA (cytosine-5)-methyltransferase 1